MTFGETLSESRYFELRYEELVANEERHSEQDVQFSVNWTSTQRSKTFCRTQTGEQGLRSEDPTRDLAQWSKTPSDWARKSLTPKDQERSLAHDR